MDYYYTVAQVIGFSGQFTFDPGKPVGMKQKLVSTERLQAWGWQAKKSLSDGIRDTYEYYLQLHNGRPL
jgi:GDP-L-fucose synthase